MLWCDNIGTTYLSANPVFHAGMKHIEINFHFVREQVALRRLCVGIISGRDQPEDLLTKFLPKLRFLQLSSKLNLHTTLSLRGDVKATNSLSEPDAPSELAGQTNHASRNSYNRFALHQTDAATLLFSPLSINTLCKGWVGTWNYIRDSHS